MDHLATHTSYLNAISHQMDRIVEMAEGGTEHPAEISSLKRETGNDPEATVEEYLLHGLKQYRVLLYHYPNLASDVDTRLLAEIVQARETVAAFGIGPEKEDQDSTSNGSIEGECGSVESQSDSDSGSDTEMHERNLPNGDCSCGAICRLALARPLTPEGEPSEEERNLQERYERDQEYLEKSVTFIASILDTCVEEAKAGETIDPNILNWAKKVRDWNRGTMRAYDIIREYGQDEIDEAMEAYEPGSCGRSFMYHFIQHYIQASDRESPIELDERVVKACKKLLEAVSEASSEIQDGEVLGPT